MFYHTVHDAHLVIVSSCHKKPPSHMCSGQGFAGRRCGKQQLQKRLEYRCIPAQILHKSVLQCELPWGSETAAPLAEDGEWSDD